MGVRSRAVVGAALLVVLLTACDVWPTLGFDPAHTGFNPQETAIGVDDVGDLQQRWWTAQMPLTGAGSSPVVAEGSVFVASGDLRVFSADGSAGCSGSPVVCNPIWTATQGGVETPTVAAHVLYTTFDGSLYAFDARGQTGCSGSPKTCQPLWRAALGGAPGSPVVSNGVVYVGTDQVEPKVDRLFAFDAAGAQGCSGSPKVCAPLWTSTGDAGATPTVADGFVYAATTTVQEGSDLAVVSAFDAAGVDGCSGTPKRCKPRWRYRDPDCFNCQVLGPPSVAGGRLYVFAYTCCSMATSFSAVLELDADGHEGCTGSEPRRCEPLRTTAVGGDIAFPKPPIALAHGLVYPVDLSIPVYDAATGTKQFTLGSTLSPPAIAGDVLYVIGYDSDRSMVLPKAFDARGVEGCSGSPKSCAPLWTGTGVLSSPLDAVYAEWSPPVVAGGTVYARVGRRLRAFRLPPG